MSSEHIPRHVAWRRQYRSGRYCEILSQLELNQRLRDIFVGLLRTTPQVKIGLPQINPETMHWFELWTHVLEEMVLRHGPFPNGFTRDILHSEPVPDWVGELGQRTAALLSDRGLTGDDVLIKFGKAQHMRALFESGAMRVSPASHYATSMHNGAIRDDELALLLSFSISRDDAIRLLRNPQAGPMSHVRRVDIEYKLETDYWIYCLAATSESRLFVDFDADACVLIRDKAAFHRRVRECSTDLFPGAMSRFGQVQYVDPLLSKTARIDVPMSKHFRFAYQREYRFAWIPIVPRAALPYVDMTLGNLEHIAELVEAR